MRIFTRDETRAALPFDRLVAALQQAFARGCTVPQRHVHQVRSGGAEGTVLLMPAWNEDGLLGIKTVNIYPGNAASGLPGLHSTYLLYDAATGRPLAMLDGDEITARRTAAASALAASFLAPAGHCTLAVVGCGRVGSLLPEAYGTVRTLREVITWDRTPAVAEALAQRLVDHGMRARAEPVLERAVAGADIVSCATLAQEPLVRGAWLRPGSHLDLIGSFTPAMREADHDCFRGASIWVDTREALQKSGELLAPMADGVFRAEDIAGDLAQLVRGTPPARPADEGRTVFKSVGTALEDLAAAALVWQGG
jgi:ornithine cyclodeaminase